MEGISSKISDLLAPKTEEVKKTNDIASKEDFLKLLVVQLQNQNPLDPMNPEDFAAQLAQFSSLEQLISINTVLKDSQNSDIILAQSINNSLTAALIGKGVKIVGDTIEHISGETKKIEFDLAEDAINVAVEIKDINGLLIKRISETDFNKGKNSIIWDGENTAGAAVNSGEYVIKVIAKNKLGGDVELINYVSGKVTGVRFDENGASLIVNGRAVDFSEVREVYEWE